MPKAANTGSSAVAKPVATKKVAESIYTSSELANAAGTSTALFGVGVTPDIVTAAFFVAGRHEATKAEAKEIVKNFLGKEGKK